MLEDIKLKNFPKKSGVYRFISNNEVIYIGSSNNLYKRMAEHKSCINKGSNGKTQQDFYQFLQSNYFTVEFQPTDNYRQLEQKLIELHNPKYNAIRANTGLGARKGREAEYSKDYYQEFKEELKQHRESHKEEIKQHQKQHYETHKQQKKQYYNQQCNYNGKTLTLNALSQRLRRKGVSNPTTEAKKYLI